MNKELIEEAGDALKLAAEMSRVYYRKPLIITYSGGKDSDVMLQLAIENLKPDEFIVKHNITTVDAPQTNRHINEVFEELKNRGIRCYKRIPTYQGKVINMWDLIVEKKMPPLRVARYCCQVFKEKTTPHRYAATGVRASESNGRKGRDIFHIYGRNKKEAKFFPLDHVKEVYTESLYTGRQQGIGINDYDVYDCSFIKAAKENKNLICSPIYKWTDNDVWEYIEDRNIKCCALYKMGYARVGCIFCCMASYKAKLKQMNDFPYIKELYIKAFDRMIVEREKSGKETPRKWGSGEEVFKWWIGEYEHNVRGQINIEDYLKEMSV